MHDCALCFYIFLGDKDCLITMSFLCVAFDWDRRCSGIISRDLEQSRAIASDVSIHFTENNTGMDTGNAITTNAVVMSAVIP